MSGLRIVPASAHAESYSHLSGSTNPLAKLSSASGAPSAPGLHDTLRAGVGYNPNAFSTSGSDIDGSSIPPPVSSHPLEARLARWEATQMALRMETLRRTFGVAEPVRRGMELRITRQGDWQPSLLKGTPGLGGSARASSVHEDILMGRDESITWEDVFSGGEELRGLGPQGGVHEEMERKLRM